MEKLIEFDENGKVKSVAGGSLQALAHKIGYKNKIPTMPKNTDNPACMRGYLTRFNNWNTHLMVAVREYELANRETA